MEDRPWFDKIYRYEWSGNPLHFVIFDTWNTLFSLTELLKTKMRWKKYELTVHSIFLFPVSDNHVVN